MGKDRDRGSGGPVEPDEARAHGNDPDAVEVHRPDRGGEGPEAGARSGGAPGAGARPEGEGPRRGGAGTAEAADGYPDGYYQGAPSRNLPPMPYKDMPRPLSLGKIVGPGIILAGLGVGSGEMILWPFIVSNLGIGMLWAALVGVTLQFFLNMEIERYTLSTGETAVSGFSRYWKPFGIVFSVFAVVPFVFPGWATGAITLLSFATGMGEGAIPYVTIVALVALGIALTVSPVVYNTIEKAEYFKVGLTVVFLLVAVFAVLLPRGEAVSDLGQVVTRFGQIPTSEAVGITAILSGLVFAGAGGALNLAQSNYIRDKGFGMGAYIPRIASPITGEEVAAPSTGSMVRQDEENLGRWRAWWRVANIEQLVTFWLLVLASITIFSLVAYSTVYGRNLAEEADFTFLQAEGEAFKSIIGGWFGNLFWLFGFLSLLLAALAIVDNISRVVADALKTVYLTNSSISESRLYFIVVWTMISVGTAILLIGLDQPLLLLVISACLNGFVMVAYSVLLLVLNRRALPDAIKVKGVRLAILAFCVLFYGFFAGWLIVAQIQGLLAA